MLYLEDRTLTKQNKDANFTRTIKRVEKHKFCAQIFKIKNFALPIVKYTELFKKRKSSSVARATPKYHT